MHSKINDYLYKFTIVFSMLVAIFIIFQQSKEQLRESIVVEILLKEINIVEYNKHMEDYK